MPKKTKLLLLGFLLTIGAFFGIYFLFFKKTKSGISPESNKAVAYTAEDNIWELAAHLAALDTVDIPRAEDFIEEELKDIKTAEEIIEYVDGAITINPAPGHLL